MELTNPEEIQQKRRERQVEKEKEEQKEKETKFYNKGGRLRVNYESEARFSIPASIYFDDYTTKDVNDLVLSREEDLLETTVAILNSKVFSEEGLEIKVEDMTTEEFLETLIGMKAQYDNPNHSHKWLHKCQNDAPEEDKKLSDIDIFLPELGYTSILDADKAIKKEYKPLLEKVSTNGTWLKFLQSKYPNIAPEELKSYTVESELEKVSIKEPLTFIDQNKGTVYKFKLSRIGDLIRAKQRAFKEIAPQIKMVKRKQYVGKPLAEQQVIKEEALEKLERERGKKVILYMQSFSLLEINGKKLNEDEQIAEYTKIPPRVMNEILILKDKINFGITEERELKCNLCGETERRSLRQNFDPIEFLPVNVDSKRKLSESSATIFHFG